MFDVPTTNPGVRLPSRLFAGATEKTVLVLETTELFLPANQRVLFVLRGNTQSKVIFDADSVDTEVKEDGAIMIPGGNSLVRITLGKNYELFMEKE